MKFLNKLERKFGKYAIHNLMKYVIGLYLTGLVVFLIDPLIYPNYFSLDIDKILGGQVWRLVTFIIQPIGTNIAGLNLFFLFIQMYLYYMIGNTLEKSWGAFRFNLYMLSGVLFNILAVVLMYAITGFSFPLGLDYINQAMFFAFAALYPNMQLMLMFVLPVKIKYLAWMYAALFAYNVYNVFARGAWFIGVAMIVAIMNFFIFFIASNKNKGMSPKDFKRRANYKRQVRKAHNTGNVVPFSGKTMVARHKCVICQKTELDDENLEFRFCSKCDGDYEYCMEHLYTHEHVVKESKE